MSAARPRPEAGGGGRRALLARLHIARKEMGLSEGTYREVLMRITGHDSAAAGSDTALLLVLAEFRRLGWKPRLSRPPSEKPFVRMIHGLWNDLKPHLADGSDEALRAFVRRQTRTAKTPAGVGAPEWLDGAQARSVIEALKAWRARVTAP